MALQLSEPAALAVLGFQAVLLAWAACRLLAERGFTPVVGPDALRTTHWLPPALSRGVPTRPADRTA